MRKAPLPGLILGVAILVGCGGNVVVDHGAGGSGNGGPGGAPNVGGIPNVGGNPNVGSSSTFGGTTNVGSTVSAGGIPNAGGGPQTGVSASTGGDCTTNCAAMHPSGFQQAQAIIAQSCGCTPDKACDAPNQPCADGSDVTACSAKAYDQLSSFCRTCIQSQVDREAACALAIFSDPSCNQASDCGQYASCYLQCVAN